MSFVSLYPANSWTNDNRKTLWRKNSIFLTMAFSGVTSASAVRRDYEHVESEPGTASHKHISFKMSSCQMLPLTTPLTTSRQASCIKTLMTWQLKLKSHCEKLVSYMCQNHTLRSIWFVDNIMKKQTPVKYEKMKSNLGHLCLLSEDRPSLPASR